MTALSDYQIVAKIYESANSLVYRVVRAPGNQPIILKILKEDYPTPAELTRYKQEYEITRSLNLDGVVKVYDLQRYQNSLAMLLEDFGGKSLKLLMAERKFTLEEFLTIAIEIAESLGAIHAANIIHKDINPSNLVYNSETGQLKIIDFGISTALSRENPTIRNPDRLEGTLAYISPEQTGRMNRAIDYRTDLYSLGITFYELLTHQLPFATTDAMELVHCHIAKQPVLPHECVGATHTLPLPTIISDMIMKLMAKTAEERYQSAWGLKADLETCLHQLRTNGQISAFPLACQDISDKFQIPQKLYGREEEVETLLAAFERVAAGVGLTSPPAPLHPPHSPRNGGRTEDEAFYSREGSQIPPFPSREGGLGGLGRSELILVAGYSGIGKSALVNEVHKPIVRQRGYFISGKFDQFKRDIPYASLIQAFQELIRQLLTESEAQLQTWKQKLLAAFGSNGQVIIDVIPEVERIVGEQPPVPQLGSTESQNRFNLVFQNFIGVFTNKEHPLVIFLDDLQWADSASLKLIQLLMTNSDSQYLLMIGAYRDNEVSPTHPLMQTLEQIQQTGTRVSTITLQPLGISHINQLIADTLNDSIKKSKPLAELVFNKTNGNPFFLTQLLQFLYTENLLTYHPPQSLSVSIQVDPPAAVRSPLAPLNKGGTRFEVPLNKGDLGGSTVTSESLPLSSPRNQGSETFSSPLNKGGWGGEEINQGRWQWDIEQIQAVGITDNVVELMIGKIEKLDERTQNVLKLAACVGNRFDLGVLCVVNAKSPSETAAELWSAIQEGLIVPLSDDYKTPLLWNQEIESSSNSETTPSFIPHFSSSIPYKFLHDRVQQAAYALIPKDQKKEVHLQVGQLLLQNTQPDKLEENIFDIVNQLNIGAELLTQQSEKDELARLNLIAGKKAKASTAYEPALRYLETGLGLLASDSWQNQYELTLEIHIETVEAQFLNTQFEQAEKLSAFILESATTLLDRVKVYELNIQSYIAKQQYKEAIDTALLVLAKLGVDLPSKPDKQRIEEEQRTLKLLLGDKQIEDLANLPVMTDSYKLAAVRILLVITSATILTHPNLYLLVTLTAVNLCIKYGNSPQSAGVYVFYGGLLCGVMQDIDSGYRFGKLSLKLLERFNVCQALVLHFYNGYIQHWKEPLRNTIELALEGVHSALETGNYEFACYNAAGYCLQMFFAGYNLEKVEQKYSEFTIFIRKLKQTYPSNYIKISSQIALNLINGAKNQYYLIDDSKAKEDIYIKTWIQESNVWLLFLTYLGKTMLAYFFKTYDQAVENAIQAEKYIESCRQYIIGGPYIFYYSLALIAQYPISKKHKQKQFLEKVSSNQKLMKEWAYHSPTNYQHKYELIEAEKGRILGRNWEAEELYDRAIKGAKEQGFIHEEAIAYERAAEFYLSIGREEIGHFYLKNAHHCYTRWGAIAKVNALESEYPQILVGATHRTESKGTTKSVTTTGGSTQSLDLSTVIKASQTLTTEIVLGKLLSKLMKIAIENAGAQKGFLILDNNGKWVIEAEGVVGKDEVNVMHSIPLDSVDSATGVPLLSSAIINFVTHTQENVVLNDATHEGQYTRDPYIIATQPKSILCTPLLNQGKLSGILYLENNLTTGAFTSDRVETLRILSAQAAISIENSRLYKQLEAYNQTLEVKVEERTQQLQEKNQELSITLQKLKATQQQIIAQEKLASLGALTAGIAHEIKNPLNFVNNFAELSAELTQELLEEIENQKDRLDTETTDYLEEILNDLTQNVKKINEHGKRADNIVRGMLMHSRGKGGDREPTDLNALLAEYVNLAYHGMRAKDSSFNITINTHYDNTIGSVTVFPQDISRVFLNVINNACYAAHDKKKQLGDDFSPRLSASTKNLGDRVEIRIRDNGNGIPNDIVDKIFNPFFTTKPTGQGTGLGLSISHDIIVQGHQGELKVETEEGKYAEFIIILPR
jgi:predicted ATPase/signal transduction histidine kinase